ncbi:MAG TPA: hypothetical protein V6D22_05255 [Candidatus Obscuribacterales bacterium]
MSVRNKSVLALIILVYGVPAGAQDIPMHRHHGVDWQRLNLSPQQSQQIQVLQSDWQGHYTDEMPQIHRQQQHLNELFRNPQSDPLEIVSTQQSLMRLQEQLRNEAMANYLHKRALLSGGQQRLLEVQMHQMVVERQQHHMVPVNQSNDENGGIMTIMQKVRWAIEPHN